MEHWVDEVLPEAIEEVSRHAGGRPVHLVGWSLGADLRPARPPPTGPTCRSRPSPASAPRSTSTQVPLVAPIRPFLGIAGERAGLVTQAYRLLGGAPKPLVRRAFQLSAVQQAGHQADRGGREARRRRLPRPGRGRRPVHREHDRLPGRALRPALPPAAARQPARRRHRRAWTTGRSRWPTITVPLLAVRGRGDGIAPVQSRAPHRRPATGVDDLRFEVVPGGHLGMLTGRAARRTTWRIIDEWITAHSSKPSPRRPRAAYRPAAARPRRPSPPGHDRHAATRQSIGANPQRRYGSASSRTLAREVSRRSARSPCSCSRCCCRLLRLDRGRPAPDRVHAASGTARRDRSVRPDFQRYVALGDSFSAGPLIPTSDLAGGCLRSDHNYPSLVAERLDVRDFVDVTCSGATTGDLAHVQRTFGDARIPPQRESVTPTHGPGDGRDRRQRPRRCSTPWSGPARSLPEHRPDRVAVRPQARRRGPDLVSATRVISARVARSLRMIRARAPQATVLLVGYLRLVPDRGSCAGCSRSRPATTP